jgi:hypothetical protein
MYGSFIIYNNNPLQNIAAGIMPIGDAFGGMVGGQDAPLGDMNTGYNTAPPPIVPAQSGFGVPSVSQGSASYGLPQQSISSVNSFGAPVSTSSIADAFSDFGPTSNAPLPSLEVPPVIPEDHTTTTQQPPILEQTPITLNDDTFGPGSTVSISDAYSGMATSDAPPVGGGLEPTKGVPPLNTIDDADDDFGDFESTPAASTSGDLMGTAADPTDAFGMAPTTMQTQAPSLGGLEFTQNLPTPMPVSDAFGALVDAQDAPLPSLDQAASNVTQFPQEDDEFGRFEAATENVAAVENPMPMSDAFGALAGVQDAPSPSLNHAALNVIPPKEEAEDDQYGGFAAATGNEVAQSFENQMPVSDAFGALVGVQDAPLPSLDQVLNVIPPQQEDTDDDFGGCEAATGNDASQIVANPMPVSDAFGALVGVQDAPLPSLHQTSNVIPPQEEDAEDEFGGFEAATGNDVIQAVENPMPVSDAFGALVGIQDAPMPSLDQASNVVPPQEEAEDDEFGGFAAATGNEVAYAVENPMPVSDAFGALGGVQDAPLPSLDQVLNVITPQEAEDDEFGGFEAATGNEIPPALDGMFGAMEGAHGPAAVSDAFGDFGSPPPTNKGMDMFESATKPQFVQQNQNQMLSMDTSGPTMSVSDVFGGLEVQDAPLPTLAQFSNVVSETEPATKEEAEDDFGGFEGAQEDEFGDFGAAPSGSNDQADPGGFEGVTSAYSSDLDNARPQPQVDPEQEADLFGDFGEAPPGSNDNADFGDFEGVTASGSGGLDNTPSQPQAGSSQEEDLFGDFGAPSKGSSDNADFGDFEGIPASNSGGVGEAPAQPQSGSTGSQEADLFGDFGAAPSSSNDNADFGDFEGVDTPAQPQNGPTSQEEDEFGDFGTAPEGSNSDADFGNFEGVSTSNSGSNGLAAVDSSVNEPAEPQETGSNDDFDDFGDFGGFEQAPASSTPAYGQQEEAPADDWGDFESTGGQTVPDVASEETNPQHFNDKIRSLSLQLPRPLLRKNGLSGEHVDLAECFEVNIGLDSPLDDQRRKRAERCIQVLQFLSRSNPKLGSTYWEQVFKVVKDELLLGKSIVLEAKKLRGSDISQVKRPLQIMMAGLVEYIRVTRSIVASVGDMLMLDSSALLTIDTWASTWCSLSILEVALHIEIIWKEIQKESSGILSTNLGGSVGLGSIRAQVSGRCPPDKLCQLTLRPLSKAGNQETMSEVTWQGKNFMACSANFLAHRCPFYVVGG